MGGEDKADVGPEIREGLVGPGKAIEAALQDHGKIVATVICGDNYFAENSDHAIEEIMAMMVDHKPHILIAGPAFNAGRYGVACGAICKAAQKKLNIPAVTAMYEENPGVDLYKKEVYILRTKDSAMGMATAVPAMVNLALKLNAKETIGRPDEEGYFPRGILKTVTMEKNAAVRAVDMLLKKMKGEAFESELTPPKFEHVAPAPPVKDLSKATIAFVTDGGLIPKGNPDKMAARAATVFGAYDIKGKDSLSGNEYQGHHLGYDNSSANQNPNRIVPLDVMRDLEREGIVGNIHNTYYTCAGVATDMANSKKIGRGIAERLKSSGVDGVILTST
jgi:glycine reductase